MLKKLLKYDLKAVFKYWWIAAVTSLGLGFAGGYAITVLRTTEDETQSVPVVIEIIATVILPIVILGLSVLIILTTVLVFARYYKNFFSDEGYLTFTLPVKRTQLINSKIIVSVTAMTATIVMVGIDVVVMLAMGFSDEIFKPQFWQDIAEFLAGFFDTVGYWLIAYVLEAVLFVIVSFIFSTLFLFDCIAFACMVAKKAKVVVAIGIYYVVNCAISIITTTFNLFGLETVIEKLSAMPQETMLPTITLFFFGVIVCIAVFTAILYALQYWLIDRKLNLN